MFLTWVIALVVHSVMSDSLQPHGLQLTRLPCPLLSPQVCSNSCPLSQWWHPTISSSVVPISSCPQSFPASGSFPISWLSASGGQSIGASASVLPMNIQAWFPLEFTFLISLLSLGLGYKWAPESPRSPFLGLLPSAGHSAPGPLSSSVKGDIVTGVVNKTTAKGLAQMEPEANVSCYPAKLMPVPIFFSPHRRSATRESTLDAG